jgi:hypothetical protein
MFTRAIISQDFKEATLLKWYMKGKNAHLIGGNMEDVKCSKAQLAQPERLHTGWNRH